jgi:phosphatidate cytidylyltransferase
MLKYRLVFGPLMIAGLIGMLILDHRIDQIDIEGSFVQSLFLGRKYLPAGLLMLCLFLVLVMVGVRELQRMFQAKGIAIDALVLRLSGLLGCTLIYLIPYTLDSQLTLAIYATVIAGLFVLTVVRYAWQRRTDGALVAVSVTMFTFIYLGLLPGFYLAIRRWHSAAVIAGVILIIKACDIGAYFTGRAIGRHKLIPWLSPGKTWEGLIVGVLFSGLVAVVVVQLGHEVTGRWVPDEQGRHFVSHAYPLWYAACAGLLFGLVGQVGDLIASLFKRDAGIKDSGRAIPGFGGLIDVIDSPILAAPLAYWLLELGFWLR